MIKKIIKFTKEHLKEIVLILCGIIVGVKLTGRKKETDLSERINEGIRNAEDISDNEKQGFREQLDRINAIADDKERMEAKLRLWQSINE